MGFLDDIKSKVLVYDGSKGYMLQLAGLPAGDSPESFNLSHPEIVSDIYKKYVEAGCDVIQTNTFTGNRILLEKHGLGDKTFEINSVGTKLAKKAASGKAYVAASIGPTGLLFEPFGELTFDKAYEIFKEQVLAVSDGGADIINLETFTDILEMKAAFLAARENASLPIVCSMAFEKNGRTLMGTDPASCVRILKGLGADLAGANCSFGPAHMVDIVKAMAVTGEYLSVKPNAGLPRVEDGKTVYDQCASEFAEDMSVYFSLNVRLIGGCCGTTPEYIKELIKRNKATSYEGERDLHRYLCSQAKSINVVDINIIKKLVVADGMDFYDLSDEILEIAYDECDAMEIEYNASDEGMLSELIRLNPSAIKKPLVLSGNNLKAIKKALRIYPGIAGLRNEVSESYGSIILG